MSQRELRSSTFPLDICLTLLTYWLDLELKSNSSKPAAAQRQQTPKPSSARVPSKSSLKSINSKVFWWVLLFCLITYDLSCMWYYQGKRADKSQSDGKSAMPILLQHSALTAGFHLKAQINVRPSLTPSSSPRVPVSILLASLWTYCTHYGDL